MRPTIISTKYLFQFLRSPQKFYKVYYVDGKVELIPVTVLLNNCEIVPSEEMRIQMALGVIPVPPEEIGTLVAVYMYNKKSEE